MAPARPTGYCSQCDAEQEIVETVSWQDDVCAACGSSEVDLE